MLRGRAVLRRPPRARGFLPGLMAGGTRRSGSNSTLELKLETSELLESLEFTWTFKALSERATRLDLALDFEMRSLEHAIMWDLAKDRILQEYVDSFKQRCDLLETAARAAAPRKRE